MARSAHKQQVEIGGTSEYSDANLYLYPPFPDQTPAIDKENRRKILDLFSSKDFIDFHNAYFLYGLMKEYFEEIDAAKFRFSDIVWESVRFAISELYLSPTQAYVGYLPMFDSSDLDKIAIHEPRLIRNFLKKICILPRDFKNVDKVFFEEIYAIALQRIAVEEANHRRPISYKDLYDYLKDTSENTEWQWMKYERNFPDRSISLIVRTYNSGDATVHLIGIDEVVAQKIKLGHYENITDEEFSEIGDHFAFAWTRDVSSAFDRKSWYTTNYPDIIDTYNRNFAPHGSITRYDLAEVAIYLNRNAVKYGLEPFNFNGDVGFIDKELITSGNISKDEVIRRLDVYAKKHPGSPVGEIAFEGFKKAIDLEVYDQGQDKWVDRSDGRRDSLIVPSVAPTTWSISNRLTINETNGDRRETAPEFIRRVYDEWLGKGMTRADLRKLDQSLSRELDRYAKEHGMPEDLIRDLPRAWTRSKNADADIDADVRRWQSGTNPDGSTATFTKAEAQRLQSAAFRRLYRE